MTQPDTRRVRRASQPVDLARFADRIDAALLAFGKDVSYAVLIARSAVTITRKRHVWQVRRELRTAEALAHQECQDTGSFECHAVSACGTGDCKFATEDHAQLHVAATGGLSRRPQYPHETYGLDEAVNALADLRAAPL